MLLGRLGSGGMGRVYLARSPGGRMVAVKVIRANLAEDAGFRARFAREVSAARKVGGLFTAQVVDADIDGPVPWLVTAYVPGTSLSDAVERQGPLPDASVLALAAGLAEGLIAIHAAGVIHRDLKPSNVLLAQDGPRIIDFGISSAAEATALTGTGFMIGSPGFMSPEQAEGLVVGPASDIFSLAGVLIYAARGEGPFGTGDTAALLYRVVHGKPNMDSVPDHLRPLIKRSLSRDPRRRPSATQFLADLSAAYPSAADLSNWLPARLLDPSAAGATSADVSGRPPAASGGSAEDLCPAVLWPRFRRRFCGRPVRPGYGGPGSAGGGRHSADGAGGRGYGSGGRRRQQHPVRPVSPDDAVADPATADGGAARTSGRPRLPGAGGSFGAGQLSGSARLPVQNRGIRDSRGIRGSRGARRSLAPPPPENPPQSPSQPPEKPVPGKTRFAKPIGSAGILRARRGIRGRRGIRDSSDIQSRRGTGRARAIRSLPAVPGSREVPRRGRGRRAVRGGRASRGACRRPRFRVRACPADRACPAPTSGTSRPRGQAGRASGQGGWSPPERPRPSW